MLDHVAHVSAQQLRATGARPGSMNLIDVRRSRDLQRRFPQARVLPGGGCANALRGLGWLAAATGTELEPPLFVGVVGEDAEGTAYATALRRAGVTPALRHGTTATGTSTVLVSPDGERTMFTCLGASTQLESCLAVSTAALAEARAFYTTGFVCDPPAGMALIRACAAAAARHSVPVVFDIADRSVVERHRSVLRGWAPGKVRVLLGNRDELRALTGCASDGEALAAAAELAPTVVMKVGEQGALVWDGGRVDAVPTVPVHALDTTGAGDAFVAGFLLRWILGGGPAAGAAAGNLLAGRIVQVDGCDYDRLDRDVRTGWAKSGAPDGGLGALGR